jgi:hypothetical protein
MSGGKGKTQTTTETKTVPAYIQEAQQNLVKTGTNLLSNFTDVTPQYSVAGFTPDQAQGFDYARYLADQAMNSTPGSVTGTAATAGPASLAAPAALAGIVASGAANAGTAQAGLTNATAAQLNPGDILKFMNPYIQGAINPTLANMRQQYDASNADIGAKYAASGAFGGSGEALARGQAARALGDQTASTVGNLMNSGFGAASGLASANTDRSQQANLTNAAAANAMAQFNAGQANNMGQFNAGQTNAMTQFNNGAANNANQFNASAQNANGQFNASAQNALNQFNAGQANSYGLNAATTNSTLQSQNQARQLAALQALLGTGTLQQQTAQQAIGAPMTALQQLAGITPQDTSYTGTKTAPNNSPGVGQQILGAGLSLLPAIFSDRNAKTDIEKLGVDPETGLTTYAYRYKGDPKSYPKVVGPMAQDVERAAPEMTRRIGGKLVISGT